ncbi:hypothetical protein SESBI_45825 [Sesbania bispinosa]|nr:hypothetical protein SESBI_45825 [Sesbania bispinosa]
MDELEHSQQELREDINQLKEQVAKVLKLLEKRGTNENPSGVSNERTVTLDPPGYVSMPTQSYGLSPQGTIVPLMVHPTYLPQLLITNPQGIQWPPYSLPPDLVIIRERMECGIKSGKIAYNPMEELDTMKPFMNEGQEEEGSPVSHSTTSSTPSP